LESSDNPPQSCIEVRGRGPREKVRWRSRVGLRTLTKYGWLIVLLWDSRLYKKSLKIYLPSTTGFSTFVSSFGAGRDSGWNEEKTRDVKCRKTVAKNWIVNKYNTLISRIFSSVKYQ
jgi:hypothetical protein